MNQTLAVSTVALAASVLASSASANIMTYGDSAFDLFDNSLSNLDIVGAGVSYDAGVLSIGVTTRGYADWTKYMIFLDDGPGGTTSNAWNRPIDLGTNQIDYFIGSWVDQATNNTQVWGWFGAWAQVGTGSNLINAAANTVYWSMAVELQLGQSIRFDVATSGGGNDPGVDHLSNAGLATDGWGSASHAGEFLTFTYVPAPGAMALLGLAGLFGGPRRRA